jgi:hypothetical protein
MPRFVYSTLFLRLFPPGFIDYMADLFGISNAMDDFTGKEPRPAEKAGTVPRKKRGAVRKKTEPQKTPRVKAPSLKVPPPKAPKTTARKANRGEAGVRKGRSGGNK